MLRSSVIATVSSLRLALPTESKKEEAGLEKGPDTPSPIGLRLRLYGEFRTQSRYFMQAKTYHRYMGECRHRGCEDLADAQLDQLTIGFETKF